VVVATVDVVVATVDVVVESNPNEHEAARRANTTTNATGAATCLMLIIPRF
jgi:hypothetical protein